MNLMGLSLERFRVLRPDLCKQLFAEGQEIGIAEGRRSGVVATEQAGISGERARAVAIIKKANTEFKGVGLGGVVERAIEHGTDVLTACNEMRVRHAEISSMKNPDGSMKSHMQLAEEYQAKHKCGITEALRVTAPMRKADQ